MTGYMSLPQFAVRTSDELFLLWLLINVIGKNNDKYVANAL
jgi:hypothetical protein